MSKEFGEPDKEKNTLSLNEEDLQKISGGIAQEGKWSNILKTIKREKQNKDKKK
ncbi:MAG: hypothetical protein LBH37_03390 [Oscillospiraceae bacterium]|jgi:bacteriocin-like protein|nr:hypothetical protein [Oscillospiraceae bacterium]